MRVRTGNSQAWQTEPERPLVTPGPFPVVRILPRSARKRITDAAYRDRNRERIRQQKRITDAAYRARRRDDIRDAVRARRAARDIPPQRRKGGLATAQLRSSYPRDNCGRFAPVNPQTR